MSFADDLRNISQKPNGELFAKAVIPYLPPNLKRECHTAAERGKYDADTNVVCLTHTINREFPGWRDKYFEPSKFRLRGMEAQLEANSIFFTAAGLRLISLLQFEGLHLEKLKITYLYKYGREEFGDKINIKISVSW